MALILSHGPKGRESTDARLRYIWVYILHCADGSYYVGITRGDLGDRIGQHNAGSFGRYTASRRPVVLVWHREFLNITDAVAAERRIKGWSRAKKEALIRGDFEALHALARYRPRGDQA
ncbi:MAG TPA: GIY-YIG nuclease family protein [Stellaceae bacterium]|nr:GIY-YIG nuclease family protein [Stellaceae bacterium]